METKRRVLVVANVSAGKSTLINTLVDKKVCRSTNFVCTSKLASIVCRCGKKKDGCKVTIGKKTSSYSAYNRNLTDLPYDKITLYGENRVYRHEITFIDSPGTNNSQTKDHEEITMSAIKRNEYELLVYISNATTQMTDDEAALLNFVKENCKKKLLIVVNKIDELHKEESVDECLQTYSAELNSRGICPEAIVPVSALGYEVLKNKSDDDYGYFSRKFSKVDYELPKHSICCNRNLSKQIRKSNGIRYNTGITFLRCVICELIG